MCVLSMLSGSPAMNATGEITLRTSLRRSKSIEHRRCKLLSLQSFVPLNDANENDLRGRNIK